jgi:hypothetical protein
VHLGFGWVRRPGGPRIIGLHFAFAALIHTTSARAARRTRAPALVSPHRHCARPTVGLNGSRPRAAVALVAVTHRCPRTAVQRRTIPVVSLPEAEALA